MINPWRRLPALVLALFAPIGPAWSQLGATEPSAILDRTSLADRQLAPCASLGNQAANLDLWLTECDAVVSRNADRGSRSGWKGDAVATLDGARLGLWNGFYVSAHAGLAYRKDAGGASARLVHPDGLTAAYPRFAASDKDAALMLMQKFSENVALRLGKFNVIDAAENKRSFGDARIGSFVASGFTNPLYGNAPPHLLGGSLGIKHGPVDFTLLVYDPRNARDWEVVANPFRDGATTSMAWSSPVTIASRKGYYGFKTAYSKRIGTTLADLPGLPEIAQEIGKRQRFWSANASFQQHIAGNPATPGSGWGMFGQVSVTEGSPNTSGWSLRGGLAGTGFVPGRSADRWGIAYFHYPLSAPAANGLAPVSLQNEPGLEAFYKIPVNQWCLLTADLRATRRSIAGDGVPMLGTLRAQLKF